MFEGHYNPNSKFDKICDSIDGFPLKQFCNLFKKLDKKGIMTNYVFERIFITTFIIFSNYFY